MVSSGLNLNSSDLAQVYTNQDTHNSESRTRYMWKYATSKGVSGTPSAFVNGVLLQEIPSDVSSWMSLLQDVYDA